MDSMIQSEFEARGSAQVLVVLRPESLAAAAAAPNRLERHFVTSENSWSGALAESAAALGAPAEPPKLTVYPHLGLALGVVEPNGLESLEREPAVEEVHGTPQLTLIKPIRSRDSALAEVDRVTWGIERLEVPTLWRLGYTGRGVLVGHLDTGVDGTHPALKGAVTHFAVFDELGRQRPRPGAPHDTGRHGTHTAATIAGRPHGGRRVGVAPGCMVASAIVIEGGNVVARILGGMDWIVGLGARVLNMSLGLPGWWPAFQPLTRILRARGVLPVFAVGNEGPGTSRSPGNYDEALSVGACDAKEQVADFSSSQRIKSLIVPDLVAPGVDVISAVPGGYMAMDGTSMATPHVAGLAALLFEARPGATVDEVENAIFQSCELGAMPTSRAHRGMPNGPRALELLGVPIGAAALAEARRGAPKRKKSRPARKATGKTTPKRPAKAKGSKKKKTKKPAKA